MGLCRPNKSLTYGMSIKERMEFYTDKSKDCWEWVGSMVAKRYGGIRVGNKIERAHRVAWELENGEIEKGLYVLHKCDNPLCVRPSHLFLGTQQDNMTDMAKKGRGTKGR